MDIYLAYKGILLIISCSGTDTILKWCLPLHVCLVQAGLLSWWTGKALPREKQFFSTFITLRQLEESFLVNICKINNKLDWIRNYSLFETYLPNVVTVLKYFLQKRGRLHFCKVRLILNFDIGCWIKGWAIKFDLCCVN